MIAAGDVSEPRRTGSDTGGFFLDSGPFEGLYKAIGVRMEIFGRRGIKNTRGLRPLNPSPGPVHDLRFRAWLNH